MPKIEKISERELPQHGQGVLDKFASNDMISDNPYFCVLVKNDLDMEILTNINDYKISKLISKQIKKAIDLWVKANKKK